MVKHIHHIGFYRNAGLLEQHAHESRESRTSRWLIPSYPSNKLVAELVQVKVNYCFSGKYFSFVHSWICLDVCNGIIRHEFNGAGVAGDCTIERLRVNGPALFN